MTTTSSTDTDDTTIDATDAGNDLEAAIGAAAEQTLMTLLGGFEAVTMHLGHELGLYDELALTTHTAPSLAGACGMDARYGREWLEQQTVAGIVDLVTDADDPDQREYGLSTAWQEVLVNPDSLVYLAPFTGMMVAAGEIAPRLRDAFRTGAGICFGEYGDLVRNGQAAANRPGFIHQLASEWLPTMPDIVNRLEAEPPALVADVGCGTGWSTIALAKAFPKAQVHGFDLDAASIADARANAIAEGVADRATFEVRNAADAAPGAYDLVGAFECVHDTGHPTDVLAAMRTMAGPGGTVLVMDEKAADEFPAGPADPIERLLYAASVLHCLPVGRSDDPDENHATGTVLREPVFRQLAADAGYQTVDVLPIDHDMFRFYRLRA